MENYDLRQKLAQNAQSLLKTEFTEEKWKKQVKEILINNYDKEYALEV